MARGRDPYWQPRDVQSAARLPARLLARACSDTGLLLRFLQLVRIVRVVLTRLIACVFKLLQLGILLGSGLLARLFTLRFGGFRTARRGGAADMAASLAP